MGFIAGLTQAQINEQIADDWGCIKNQIFGDRDWDEVKGHVGRIAGVKLIEVNMDLECDETDEAFGSQTADGLLSDVCDCAAAMGVEVPMRGEALAGNFAQTIMLKILLKIMEDADWGEWIESLIRSWID